MKKKIGKEKKILFKNKLLVPILIFLLSFAVRVIWIGKYVGQDEIYYVGYTFDLIRGKSFQNVFPPFFEIFLSPFALLAGENFAAIHIFMAILGAINVLAVYWIGKKFLNEWAGIVAALLLTFNTTHWFFSDFGMLDVPVTLFSTISLFYLWSGYKKKNIDHLIVGSLFGCFSVLTKYGFFVPLAMLGYIVLFDRKSLKDKRLLAIILIPLVVFGLWMYYYITQLTGLWSWWQSYLMGKLEINIPYYIYLESTYNEFLLPILTVFVLFTSLFFLAKKVGSKARYVQYIFLILFVLIFYYLNFTPLQPQAKAAIGFSSLALLGLNYWKKDFNRYMILIILLTFAYYSAIAVKFPRYVMPALPAVYLLVGQLFYDIKKYRIYLLVGLGVLLIFILLNSTDTINKLLVDSKINDVKYTAQQYMIANSEKCSVVISKTWYGFYYVRDRVNDLSDVNGFLGNIRSRCSCPPKYVVSEGYLSSEFLQYVEKEKSFSGTAVQYRIDERGFRVDETAIANVDVYRIKDEVVKEQCK